MGGEGGRGATSQQPSIRRNRSTRDKKPRHSRTPPPASLLPPRSPALREDPDKNPMGYEGVDVENSTRILPAWKLRKQFQTSVLQRVPNRCIPADAQCPQCDYFLFNVPPTGKFNLGGGVNTEGLPEHMKPVEKGEFGSDTSKSSSDEEEPIDLAERTAWQLRKSTKKLGKVEAKLKKVREDRKHLHDKCEELDKIRKELSDELLDTKGKLEAAEERIVDLEERDDLWRARLLQVKEEKIAMAFDTERANMRCSEAEDLVYKKHRAMLVKAIEDAGLFDLRERHLLDRIAGLVSYLEPHFARRDDVEALGVCFVAWRSWMQTAKIERLCGMGSESEGSEVDAPPGSPSSALRAMGKQIKRLELELEALGAKSDKHKEVRDLIGTSIVGRVLRSGGGCGAVEATTFRAWNIFVLAQQFDKLEKNHLELQECHAVSCERLGLACAEVDSLTLRTQAQTEIARFLEEDARSRAARTEEFHAEASRRCAMELRQREAEHALEQERVRSQAAATLAAERSRNAIVEARQLAENDALEVKIDDLNYAMKPGNPDRPLPRKRVIARGEGVLCAGCMKQLLHRDIRQLPPAEALRPKSDDMMASEKSAYLSSVLQGALDSDDASYEWLYRSQKDPYMTPLSLDVGTNVAASPPVWPLFPLSTDRSLSSSARAVDTTRLPNADDEDQDVMCKQRPTSQASTTRPSSQASTLRPTTRPSSHNSGAAAATMSETTTTIAPTQTRPASAALRPRSGSRSAFRPLSGVNPPGRPMSGLSLHSSSSSAAAFNRPLSAISGVHSLSSAAMSRPISATELAPLAHQDRPSHPRGGISSELQDIRGDLNSRVAWR